MTIDLGEVYKATRDRISQLAAGESVDPRLPVAATPDWTVHCVFAHLSGIAADASTGNMEGAPGEAWPAEQVATAGLPPVEVTASDFEWFGARLGRRTVAEVSAYTWSADPAPYLDSFFIFGRATSPLGESSLGDVSLGMRE